MTALILSSCNNDDGMEHGPEAGSMTAEIDGNVWVANTAVANRANGFMNISGQSASGEVITITIDGVDLGAYPLTMNSGSAGAYTEMDGAIAFTSNATAGGMGEINLTEINEEEKWVSGNFNFVATRAWDNAPERLQKGYLRNCQ